MNQNKAIYIGLLAALLTPSFSEASEQQPQERRIVRVISSSDDSSSEVESEAKVVVVGGDGGQDFHWVSDISHRRGFLGVQLVNLTPELREHFGTPTEAGVLISRVEDDSPAAQAGLRVGDILSAIDGEPVASGSEVARTIGAIEDNSVVTLEVWRDGDVTTLSAEIVERERPAIDLSGFIGPDHRKIEKRIQLDLEGLPERIIEIDQERLSEALEGLTGRFSDPDFVKRFHSLGPDRVQLQERIEELEERLRDLEKQLEKLPQE